MPKVAHFPQHRARKGRGSRPTDLDLVDLRGAPALLPGEDPLIYTEFREQLRKAAAPTDFIGELLVQDMADLAWEVLRLRRLKASLLAQRRYRGLEWILARGPEVVRSVVGELLLDEKEKEDLPKITDEQLASHLVGLFAQNHAFAVKAVDRILRDSGLGCEDLMASTLVRTLDELEPIEGMIAQAETRRNAAFREMERHRDVMARRLRDAVADIEDAIEVEVAEPSGKAAP